MGKEKSTSDIHCVTYDSESKDHGSEGIASIERVTVEKLCDCLVAVFLMGKKSQRAEHITGTEVTMYLIEQRYCLEVSSCVQCFLCSLLTSRM